MNAWVHPAAISTRTAWLDPSPIVALNRAVAVAELDRPDVALALIDPLPLTCYHPWHAARAEMHRQAGRPTQAEPSYAGLHAVTTPGKPGAPNP